LNNWEKLLVDPYAMGQKDAAAALMAGKD